MAKQAQLVSIRITCPEDGRNYTVKYQGIDATGHEEECELCGTHGSVELDVTCTGCGQNHTIELKEW